MKSPLTARVATIAVAVAAVAILGCSKADVTKETVATANAETISVSETREFLGIRGGASAAADVPLEKKREALDRLIAGRLLAQEARSRGLDNTEEFRAFLKKNEQGILITALFRREIATRLKVNDKEVEAQAKKLREQDKSLSAEAAEARARRTVSQASLRNLEEELVSTAKKEVPSTVHQEVIDRIGKREKVGDTAVLATVGAETVTYGDVKKALAAIPGAMHGGGDIARNPVAVGQLVGREVRARTLAAYAKKQGLEGSDSMKAVRAEAERSVLIDQLASKVLAGQDAVTDQEVRKAYEEHRQMFVREGKEIPLAEVREQVKAFLQNEKRKKALETYVAELRGKAKVTVDEKVLQKV